MDVYECICCWVMMKMDCILSAEPKGHKYILGTILNRCICIIYKYPSLCISHNKQSFQTDTVERVKPVCAVGVNASHAT